MQIAIDNADFCIRLYKDVVYIKVLGHQDENGAMFFSKAVDELIENYPHHQIVSLCDLQELILSNPKEARIINRAIVKLSHSINFKYNAIIVKNKFFDIIQAYIFSYYLKNAKIKSKVFFNQGQAAEWLENKGYDMHDIKAFINNPD
ncbi:hypothetical protein [Plebeiibacterium marinum]|uniref:Uncharacterized protein n=1 Tax=Plebeiibacterium marinum TaxID=2992111 RepID=A0AAE3MHB0_9BACT|nr:hypothetical protein [Plebeiobacterium marinum]MCW3807584.1 hypothetical protein [Plebeiobacterium marinum]